MREIILSCFCCYVPLASKLSSEITFLSVSKMFCLYFSHRIFIPSQLCQTKTKGYIKTLQSVWSIWRRYSMFVDITSAVSNIASMECAYCQAIKDKNKKHLVD